MRAIMNVFKYKKARKLKRKKGASVSPKKGGKVYEEFGIKKQAGEKSKNEKENDPLLVVSNKFDLLDEIQRQ